MTRGVQTLDIQEKALSTLRTSPDAPSRRKQVGRVGHAVLSGATSTPRTARTVLEQTAARRRGSDKYVTTELSDKDVQVCVKSTVFQMAKIDTFNVFVARVLG